MGSLQAEEMANLADNDTGLRWHLQGNHYPPIHLDFLPAVKQAIELAKGNQWDEEIELPNGRILDVQQIINGLHLWPWVDREADDVVDSICDTEYP